MVSRLATALVGLALMTAPAAAQDAPKETHREGEYGGVKAGDGQGAKPVKRGKPGTLSWVGFSAEGGTGHVFLQSTSEIGYTQAASGKVLVVKLTGVKRFGRQVRRPLDTRFFESPVVRITVKKLRKGAVEVRIQMKSDAHEATVRTATEADGFHYLYLDISP
jgi:hypothetical protein